MKKASRILIIVAILAISFAAYSAAIYLKQFDFNDDRALDKWGKMILNGQVKYLLMKHGSNGYVEALSDKTCSALYYRVGFNLKDYPLLTWKWQALKFPDRSKAKTEKEMDDYAARVYVIFPFLNFSSSKFIEYVWDENSPVNTISKSPQGNNIRLIVVRNGKGKPGEWIAESRNVYEDYVKAFGVKPRLKAGAIAIMCDADGTKTEAESLFDDIAIGNEAGSIRRLAQK